MYKLLESYANCSHVHIILGESFVINNLNISLCSYNIFWKLVQTEFIPKLTFCRLSVALVTQYMILITRTQCQFM